MTVTVRAATDADCVALAASMRRADVEECAVSSGLAPLDALRDAMSQSSHANAAVDGDGRVICIFGVGQIGFLSDIACPWMLCSDLVEDHWRLFVRRSRGYLAAILALYPHLVNQVDARQVAAIRWLRWLGADIGPALPIGRGGALMHVFELRGGDV